jgi:hypothetical protein
VSISYKTNYDFSSLTTFTLRPKTPSVFECDHSSYPELIDFVTKTNPKEVVPIVSIAEPSGFMKLARVQDQYEIAQAIVLQNPA